MSNVIKPSNILQAALEDVLIKLHSRGFKVLYVRNIVLPFAMSGKCPPQHKIDELWAQVGQMLVRVVHTGSDTRGYLVVDSDNHHSKPVTTYGYADLTVCANTFRSIVGPVSVLPEGATPPPPAHTRQQ